MTEERLLEVKAMLDAPYDDSPWPNDAVEACIGAKELYDEVRRLQQALKAERADRGGVAL